MSKRKKRDNAIQWADMNKGPLIPSTTAHAMVAHAIRKTTKSLETHYEDYRIPGEIALTRLIDHINFIIELSQMPNALNNAKYLFAAHNKVIWKLWGELIDLTDGLDDYQNYLKTVYGDVILKVRKGCHDIEKNKMDGIRILQGIARPEIEISLAKAYQEYEAKRQGINPLHKFIATRVHEGLQAGLSHGEIITTITTEFENLPDKEKEQGIVKEWLGKVDYYKDNAKGFESWVRGIYSRNKKYLMHHSFYIDGR